MSAWYTIRMMSLEVAEPENTKKSLKLPSMCVQVRPTSGSC